jgi:hypothetical protein
LPKSGPDCFICSIKYHWVKQTSLKVMAVLGIKRTTMLRTLKANIVPTRLKISKSVTKFVFVEFLGIFGGR